ncbi:trans-sialidase, putative, partial [Trypanosoma cruzi marinkellei]
YLHALGSSKGKFFAWRDVNKEGGETVGSLRVPSLVEINGKVFAVAEAQCKNETCLFNGIASELLTLSDPKLKEELDKTKLKTEVLDKSPYEKVPFEYEIPDYDGFESEKKVHVRRPTTLVNGSDIYMLAGNYSWTYDATEDAEPPQNQWGLLLVTGNVTVNDKNEERIYWNDTYGIPCTLFNQHHGSLTGLIGSGGSGVKTKDGTF